MPRPAKMGKSLNNMRDIFIYAFRFFVQKSLDSIVTIDFMMDYTRKLQQEKTGQRRWIVTFWGSRAVHEKGMDAPSPRA